MDDTTAPTSSSWLERAQLAGVASLGAGAIHLSAAGIHAEHPTLARAFVVLGALQIVTGLVLALGGGRWSAASVVAVNAAAVVGWVLTRTTGISWIDGLETSEAPQFADAVCAVLGAIAAALGVAVLARGSRPASRVALVGPGLVVGALSVAAMLATATHVHGHEEADAVTGHDHGGATEAPEAATAGAPEETVHEHVQPPTTDQGGAVDLSGVEGVSAEQEQFAEDLVARTRADLPQWADPAVAEAAGFHSIGDGATGFEHYVQWDWIEDDVWLDPDHPESLVYVPQPDGSKQLVSAMFMLPGTVPLEQVPDWGGRLMQWHVHDNLCYTADEEAPQVRGVTSPDGTCRPPLVKLPQHAMIHVWITPHECGPFAALEGVGAGAIEAGEQRWCDHAHGA